MSDYALMTSKTFNSSDLINRVTAALHGLPKVQEPCLQACWQHNPRESKGLGFLSILRS